MNAIVALAKSCFAAEFIKINRPALKDFEEWVFLPGMLFGSRETWWMDAKKRTRPHEGLDLCLYATTGGRIERVQEDLQIPALYSGTVVALIADFLGTSVFVRSPHFPEEGDILWAFGHMHPRDDLYEGAEIQEGEILGALAPAGTKRTGAPPHLHLSLASLEKDSLITFRAWEPITNSDSLRFLDPLPLLGRKYRILNALSEGNTCLS